MDVTFAPKVIYPYILILVNYNDRFRNFQYHPILVSIASLAVDELSWWCAVLPPRLQISLWVLFNYTSQETLSCRVANIQENAVMLALQTNGCVHYTFIKVYGSTLYVGIGQFQLYQT